MPFTLAHPAAVLPLRGRLPLPALAAALRGAVLSLAGFALVWHVLDRRRTQDVPRGAGPSRPGPERVLGRSAE